MAGLAVVIFVLLLVVSVLLGQQRSVRAERDEALVAVEHALTHDPLTKLPNRALFTARLDHALVADVCGAVLILDIDRLAEVNDALGHDAGDELLVEVADRLRTSLRSDDLVARLSGGEFVALLRSDPETDLMSVAERVIEQIRTSRPTPHGTIDLAAKVGMVQWNEQMPATSAADLLRAAERAMHGTPTAARQPTASAG